MDLEHLQTLRRRLFQDSELGPIWHYFMDHFGEDPEFHKLGICLNRHAFLEAMLGQVAKQICTGVMLTMQLRLLPEHEFIHGGFQLGGRLCGLVFFEKDQIGLAAISELGKPEESKFIRFSAPPSKPPKPSRN
jgi:hypothetical protein